MEHMQVTDWNHFLQKERNSREEFLLQSMYKLDPAYWSGIRMAEDFLYGAFSFHEEEHG